MRRIISLVILCIVAMVSCTPQEAPVVAVSTLTLSAGEHEMYVDDVFTLEVGVAPLDATDPLILWESLSPEVASVADGVVTALSPGVTYVVAKVEKDHVKAACKVTVFPLPDDDGTDDVPTGPETPDAPETPEDPDAPDTPDAPVTPEIPEDAIPLPAVPDNYTEGDYPW